jgi:hypothetical protein
MRAVQRACVVLSRFWSDSARPVRSQATSPVAAQLAVDTQVGSNPEKDANIEPSSMRKIAAASHARRIICRRTFGSHGGSGFWIDNILSSLTSLTRIAGDGIATIPVSFTPVRMMHDR